MFEVQLEVKIYQFGLLFVHENTIYNINRFVLQVCGVFTWRVSDCEELVGVTHKVMMGMPLPRVLVFEVVIICHCPTSN